MFGLTTLGLSGEYPVAPAPRTVEGTPFDLTYLPPDCCEPGKIQLLVAVRPSVVFGHPDAGTLATRFDRSFLRLTTRWFGTNWVAGPGVAAIDSILLSGETWVEHSGDKERPYQAIGFARGMVIRTKTPFDWSAAIAAWYPKAKKDRHNGAVFTGIPIPAALLALFAPEARSDEFAKATIPIYIPDDRTLVMGPEDSIRKLIDRVQAREKVPVPVGWDDVERSSLAVAITVPNRGLVDKLPGGDVEEAKLTFQIARRTKSAVFGLWAGKTTSIRMAFATENPNAAKEVEKRLRDFRPFFAEAVDASAKDIPGSTESRFTRMIPDLAHTGRIERNSRTVRVKAETSESLRDLIIPMLDEFIRENPVIED